MKRSKHLALRIMCPSCGVGIGQPCLKNNGETRRAYHQERHDYQRKSASKTEYNPRPRHLTNEARNEWAMTRARVFSEKGSDCVYCGAAAWHVDHKMPRCRGGTDDLDNLVPACGDCNRRKGGLTYEEFTR